MDIQLSFNHKKARYILAQGIQGFKNNHIGPANYNPSTKCTKVNSEKTTKFGLDHVQRRIFTLNPNSPGPGQYDPNRTIQQNFNCILLQISDYNKQI
jgi:hypothetical protein